MCDGIVLLCAKLRVCVCVCIGLSSALPPVKLKRARAHKFTDGRARDVMCFLLSLRDHGEKRRVIG